MMIENEQIRLAKEGSAAAMEALMEKYRPLAKAKARDYYTPCGDSDDLLQEGMLGLYKAVLGFNFSLGKPFAPFAALCIERQIKTAVTAALRQKHIPLNTSVPLESPDDTDELAFRKLADKKAADPEAVLIGNETARMLSEAVQKHLSRLELATLKLHMEGRTLGEISELIGTSKKSVKNALQRTRNKIERMIFCGGGKAHRRDNGRKQAVGAGECV